MKNIIVAVFFMLPISLCVGEPMKTGRGEFVFSDWGGAPINVYYTLPINYRPDTPTAIVMHGASRTAEKYRNDWHGHAVNLGFVVLAPEFPKTLFPGREGYVLGNRTTVEGTPVPPEQWVFSAVEPLFDDVNAELGLVREKYHIYGHSGGCQFLHRFMYAIQDARIASAACANAGWYTLPDFTIDYPYGLANSNVSEDQLKQIFATRFTLLLGDMDIDPAHESLNRSPGAMLQGPHRFARGHHFFFAAVTRAKAMGVPLNWSMAIVHGVAHDNKGMTNMAAPLLMNGTPTNY